MSGKLTKMKIVAYSDPDYNAQLGSYDVLFNPENIQQKKEQQFSNSNSTNGSSAQTVTYKGGGSSNFDVVLFFDGTGIISNESVEDQIGKLKKLTYDYNGDIHEPNYLRIYWGTQSLFQGRLESWHVSNTLIDLDGSPMRAELTISLVSSVSAKKKALEEKKNSSDLTHVRIVKDGDNLPLMCYRIYGDSSFYIKVARANNLTNFRKLKPGDQIVFPPKL
jgi:hypothetical protein